MKAYGHSRDDKWACAYRCCTSKSDPQKLCRPLVDRARRKKARQADKMFTSLLLKEHHAAE